LDALPRAELIKVPPSLGGPRSLGSWIIHGWHDEAKHSGEMLLLLKLCQRESS
jgi:hypothetical protein